MEDIPQTSRTLVLDQFNPQMPDLITEIGDCRGIDSLDDTAIDEINSKLLVYSYREFHEKMKPVVYSFFDANSQSVRYTLDKPESLPDHLITEIPLGEQNDVLKMLSTMVDAKRSQGSKNIDFGFENILQLISPKKVLDDIRQVRKELQTNYAKYAELPEGDPKKDELGNRLNNLFQEARENYSNTMALLPLAIEDAEQRLLLGADEDGGSSAKIAAGIARFDEDGTLKILEAPKVDETALALRDSATGKELAVLLEKDYEDSNEDESSDFVKALVVRTFSPLSTTVAAEIDYEKETANHNAYLQLYTDSKADFIRVVKPLVEKILGVREFFGQYTVKNKSGMRPSMLLANIAPEMLAKSGNLSRLRTYLNSVNNKNEYTNSVWFAVMPNLIMNKEDDVKVVRKVFEVKDEKRNRDTNSMETLAQLASALSDYQVKTFFSFETGERTTFDTVAREGVAAFKDRCEPLIDKAFSAYAVPCLPNVTVIPKNRSGVVTGKLMQLDGDTVVLSEEQEHIMRFWIEGIYISASYIAAGMMAAWQCPEYLREHFQKNVDPRLPGVRYDIEMGNNALVTTTTLAREIAGFTKTVKDDINHQNFGFILASEKIKGPKGQNVNHLIVYKARSLASDGLMFEPVYQTQVATYFERVLRQQTGDNKQQNIVEFFSTNPRSQMSKWGELREKVNAVIRQGDEVSYEMDPNDRSCNIHFSFGGAVRNMHISLQRSTAGYAV